MLSIAEIKKDESILRVVKEVTEEFLDNHRPTAEPYLYKQLRGRDDIIAALVTHDFLRRFFADELVPGLLAFEYSDRKRSAQGCANAALSALANLFEECDYRQKRFNFADIL